MSSDEILAEQEKKNDLSMKPVYKVFYLDTKG